MAITINSKIYRNLQEQVEENAKDIEELQEQFDDGYYTKEESDAKFQTKADMSDYYDKTESDAKFQTKADMSDYYDKTESNTIFQTKIGMELYATQQQLNLNIAATEARTDLLLANKQDTLVSGTNIKTVNGNSLLGSGNIDTTYTAGTGIDITNNEISIDNTVALKTDIPNYTGGSGITINSGNVVSADSTLARVADIPSITGLTMYNYKITISGVDGGTSNTRSAVYIVTLPYQWDYSSLSKIEIIRLIPVWSVVVDTDTSAGNKNIGRFHWQTSAISVIDWVDGTHTVMDFTGGFNATISAAAPAHW